MAEEINYWNQMYANACDSQPTPSTMYRPTLFIDGNKWCALYGENVQDGVSGFGDSPELAMIDFNKNFTSKIKQIINFIKENTMYYETKKVFDSEGNMTIYWRANPLSAWKVKQ